MAAAAVTGRLGGGGRCNGCGGGTTNDVDGHGRCGDEESKIENWRSDWDVVTGSPWPALLFISRRLLRVRCPPVAAHRLSARSRADTEAHGGGTLCCWLIPLDKDDRPQGNDTPRAPMSQD